MSLRSLPLLHRHASISKVLSVGKGDKLPNLSGMSQTKSEDGINRKVEKRRGGGGGKESEVEDHLKQTHILWPKMSITQGNIHGIACVSDYPL